MTFSFRSIRWRLQIWHGFILFAVLAGFGFTAQQLERGNELRRIDQDLTPRVNLLLDSLRRGPPRGPPPDLGQPPPDSFPPPPRHGPDGPFDFPPPPQSFKLAPEAAFLFEGTNGFYYIIWRRDGVEVARSQGAPTGIAPPPMDASAPRRIVTGRTRGVYRELYSITPPGECLLAGRSIESELSNLRQSDFWLAGFGIGVMAIGLAGGWWLAGRAIRPIDAISAAAARIATGDLSHRIAATDSDTELGKLTTILNSTFARLESSFKHQAQFTSDASHELRTPVSVILNQTQVALARERSAAEYRGTIEACNRAAQRMRRLIESLLELARLDAGQDKMKREPFDLAKVAQESIELVRPLADERKIELKSTADPTPCVGDAERIGQVIINLLTNAIRYNHELGEVKVGVWPDPRGATLIVSDTGPGISARDVPHIFDRFYRADTSRTAATGGVGLGLAIAKAVVEAHGGTIEVESRPGLGSTFTVRLPTVTSR